MATGNADVDMLDTADQSNQNVVSDPSIPGGEPQVEPEEPTQAEARDAETMGCANSSPNSNDNPVESGRSRSKSPTKSSPATKKNKPDSNATSKTSHQSTDEDEKRTPSPSRRTTRSMAKFLYSGVNFDDSDGEENPRYASYAKRDILEYRANYPNARQTPRLTTNLDFYQNKISSYPDGDYIDKIHKNWFGDYRNLEFHHGFIQWLFPLQEKGMNWSADPLQKHEIKAIKEDKKAMQRILKSYKLMLDFYGFQLVDTTTGEIRRLDGDAYKSRFHNLNRSSHNYLRITRILKCLGEFDYEYLKFPFLAAILRESITEDTLPNCLRSCKDYWIETLRSRAERRAIRDYARGLIEYQRKRIFPPSTYCAVRPSSDSKANEEMES